MTVSKGIHYLVSWKTDSSSVRFSLLSVIKLAASTAKTLHVICLKDAEKKYFIPIQLSLRWVSRPMLCRTGQGMDSSALTGMSRRFLPGSLPSKTSSSWLSAAHLFEIRKINWELGLEFRDFRFYVSVE